MAPRRRTTFDARGLNVGGRSLPFYAGAMHYWRVPPAAWSRCLRALRAQGLVLVETYVPWRVHARGASFDFTGPRDLGRFLDEAAAADLAVVLRPGPAVNGELTSFGLPDHVLVPPNLAVTARGTPAWFPAPPRAFPIPSYASASFHAAVRTWFGAVAEVVGPRLASVAAIGVDNETQLFFRLGAFDLDYHPDAIAWWHEHDAGDPPRDASDPARAAAWVRWKDVYVARALAELSAALDAAGLDVARCHNLAPTEPTLHDLPRIASAIGGVVGVDVHAARADFGAARRRALHCVGSSPTPLALECGMGFVPWLPPIDRDDDPDRARDQLLTLLSAGIRGFNLYMAVERDRYYGAAIDARGAVATGWIAPLIAALDEVDWPSLRRVTPLALIASRADARFGIATSVLDPVTPVLLDLLVGASGAAELGTDPAAIAHRRWLFAIERALALAAVPYHIVDEGVAVEVLARYRAVVVPTIDRIDRGLLAALHQLTATIVIGPGTPTRDELDRPLAAPLPGRLGRIRPGSLSDLPSLAEDLAGLVGDPAVDFQVERPAGVEAAIFSDAAGAPRVVFVQSFADQPVTATLTSGGPLRDPFSPDVIPSVDGAARIELRPRGIRMLLVS